MTAYLHARRLLRRLSRGLVALFPLVLAVSSLSARAEAISPAPAKSVAQKAPAQSKHKSARSAKARRHGAAAPKSKARRKSRRDSANDLELKSGAVLVVDQDSGETLLHKNADRVLPVASLTKLMTALVVVDAAQPLDEDLQISSDDVDTVKRTHSRLKVGTHLSRDEMLLLALMSSENRAAMALSRNYPGGRPAFITAMNQKAAALGMASTHFADPAGLSKYSVSTARDLHRLLSAADAQPLIRNYSTQPKGSVRVGRQQLTFTNSNRLVRKAGDWDIGLQKTGFTNEAGRCLVMQANVLSRRLAMIFLDSAGTLTRYADAARVRRRLELEARVRQPAGAVVKTSASS